MKMVTFLAFAIGFAGLAYIFVKNLLRAKSSGEINNRGLLVRRAESPVFFWITFGIYAGAAGVAALAAGACILALPIIALG
jgi:hypothetical protein